MNDDSDEDHFVQQMVDSSIELVQELYVDDYGASSSHHRGSMIGKHANIDRERATRHSKLKRDYFGNPPHYPNDKFRRRFHMCRSLFTRFMNVVCQQDVYTLHIYKMLQTNWVFP